MEKALIAAGMAVFFVMIFVPVSDALTQTKFISTNDGYVTFEIDNTGFPVSKISFEIQPQENFRIVVEEDDGDDEWVYSYFVIDAIGMEGQPESIVFDIRISKFWINSNNVDTSTLYLNMYDDEDWKRIDIVKFSEDVNFIHYKAEVPILEALFAITGEPVPVNFRITSLCNSNDVCEPENGETTETCGDCLNRVRRDICAPFQLTCAGDYVMECNNDGTDYVLTPCDYGCSDGQCIAPGIVPTAGMVVAGNPWYLAIVALLSSIIAYLFFSLRRTKEALDRIEKIATTQDNIKAIAERKD